MTISVTSGSDNGDPTPAGDTYGLASADDTGPVEVITEDPSCAVWTPIITTFSEIQQKGWADRDESIPASRWTAEQRAQYEEVRGAAITAAEQAVPLARLTPHRVMREFYEQFIAYARAYSEAIPNYEPADERLARAMISSSAVLVHACDAINSGSAAARAPLIESAPPPDTTAPLADPANPKRFMTEPDPICPDWIKLLEGFDVETDAWQSMLSSTPASQWTAEERRIVAATIPVFNAFADRALEIADRTSNPILADFITFSAQYRRAYAAGLPSYIPADQYLAFSAASAASTVYNACRAPRG